MWYKEDNFLVKIGGNTYKNCKSLIVHNGTPVFTIVRADSNEQLGINFTIRNEQGEKIAEIKQGRIYDDPKFRFERIVTENEYKLLDKETGESICHIKKRGASAPFELDVNCRLYLSSGKMIHATPDGSNIDGSNMTGCFIEDSKAGYIIND